MADKPQRSGWMGLNWCGFSNCSSSYEGEVDGDTTLQLSDDRSSNYEGLTDDGTMGVGRKQEAQMGTEALLTVCFLLKTVF